MRDDLDRLRVGIWQAAQAPQLLEAPPFLLVRITGATAISGATKRWTYDWEAAKLTGTTPAAKGYVGAQTGTAISVSELSNDATSTYSYGVDPANLPGSFDAVRIPDGAFVIVFPYRDFDGALVWLIPNTQAIDGECT